MLSKEWMRTCGGMRTAINVQCDYHSPPDSTVVSHYHTSLPFGEGGW